MKATCHITLIIITFAGISAPVYAEEITPDNTKISPVVGDKATTPVISDISHKNADSSATTTNTPPPVKAAKDTSGVTTVDGQRMEIYLGREMRVFGDAELHRGEDYVKGDRIDMNTQNDELHATGNVQVKQGTTVADGDELKLKMQDHLGEMQNPIFHMTPAVGPKTRGNATTMFFDGPNKERLTNASYTSCGEGIDDWYLRAKELDIDHYTETVTARNASIEFKGVPFIYTPWIDIPYNSERKSGFMTPTFGVSTLNGLEATIPYYWNIAPNQDATISPRFLSSRGVQLQGEYRYLEDHFFGTADAEVLPDDSKAGITRYYLNLKHTQDFGDGWSGDIQFEKVSDGQYFTDMSTQIAATSQVNLPEQFSVGYNNANWHFSALVQRYQTLDNISYTYERLPQLTLTNSEDYDVVTTNLYSELVYFDRNGNAPATLNGVPVPTGGRFTLYPSISVPFTESYGYITPKLGLHLTQYDLSGTGTTFDKTTTRILPIVSIDSGLYFDRDLRVVKNKYTQTLEPRLFYVYIPRKNQDRIPNFDTALSDLNLSTIFSENQFSGGDRVNDANQVTLALTSRMLDQKTGIQRLSATIGQRYYFSNPEVTLPVVPGVIPTPSSKSDILTALTVELTNGWYADTAWEYNTGANRTIKSNLSARYQPEPGKILNMGYRFTKDSLEQLDISGEWPLGNSWYGVGRLNYSLRDHVATAVQPADVSGPIEYLAGVEYNAGCWQTRAILQRLPTATADSTAKANYAFFVQLELSGFSKIGSNPLDVINRSIYGYTDIAKLPSAPQ
ncbi:MAG TPA: LPS-assembly protein LptD [Methylophilaceae bacterium]